MLGTFLEKLNTVFDRRFIIAYWTPIFIGFGLAVGGVGLLLGYAASLKWWNQRSATEQVLVGIAVLFVITVLAYVLEVLTIPVVRLYEGYWPKNFLPNWMFAIQRSRKAKSTDSARYYNFPRNSSLLKPTRLGNVLTSAEEYPFLLYQMDAVLWWPRLVPLLPETLRTQVDAELTPMLATLNLSMVFTLLTLEGEIITGLVHGSWWVFVCILFGGLLFSWLFYVAAAHQAVNYAEMVRVAFDLYRYDILKQMHIPVPDNLFEERLLWDVLNKWLYTAAPPWEISIATNSPSPPANPFYNDTHSAN